MQTSASGVSQLSARKSSKYWTNAAFDAWVGLGESGTLRLSTVLLLARTAGPLTPWFGRKTVPRPR